MVLRLIVGLILLLIPLSPARGQDGQADREAIDRWLFLDESEAYNIGDRTYRWESDIIVLLYYEPAREEVAKIITRLHESGLGDRRVFLLPPIDEVNQGGYDHPTLEIFISTDAFEHMLATGGLAGLEAYQNHAKTVGCYAHSHVPERGPEGYWIKNGRIVARDDLSDEALADCILRGFLLNFGLMYSERLAFDPEALSPAEQAEALAVLQALYTPTLWPGLTREEFFQALTDLGQLKD